MARGLLAFLFAMMLATHAATPARACTVDVTISSDSIATIDVHALDLVAEDGQAGSKIAPHHHNAPCQDHCNWFASILLQGFLPLEQGANVEPAGHMLPALLAVAVPPPQTAS